MRKTSPQFNRGVLTGVLLLGGMVAIAYLLAPPGAVITPSVKLLAALNVPIAFGGAFFLYRRETRLGRPGAA